MPSKDELRLLVFSVAISACIKKAGIDMHDLTHELADTLKRLSPVMKDLTDAEKRDCLDMLMTLCE